MRVRGLELGLGLEMVDEGVVLATLESHLHAVRVLHNMVRVRVRVRQSVKFRVRV